MIKFNKMVALSIVAGLVVLLQGCGAQNVKLSQQDRSQIKNLKSIKVVYHNAGWPTLKTAAGVLASDLTLGLSEDWSAGRKLAHKLKVKDPGKMIKDKFLKQVNSGTKVANFTSIKEPLTYEERTIENLKAKYNKGTVLKITPWNWQIWYFPTNWARYQMWFNTRAELIRLEDSKVLWKTNCKANQNNSKTAPTYDELTADDSKVLQRWIDDATTQCSQQLVNDFLGNV